MSDTIVAIATPPGRGGVGVIRISGSLAAEIGLQLTKKKNLVPRNAGFGRFYSNDNSVLDSGLIIFFPNPSSFTGEDVVELHAHGSPVVLDMLLHRILQLGARLARPGEFSERAFLNNKIDLVQAEAIADLIAAGTEQAALAAQRSLQGDFSSLISEMVEELIELRMYVEAAFDFPDEDIDFITDNTVQTKLSLISEQLQRIENQAQQGVLLSEGITVAIVGKPNVGKSTLLNVLTGEERAIVTPIAGTTRDVIKAQLNIDGLLLNVTDTAGLRDTDDLVESVGIDRARKELMLADLVLLVLDASVEQPEDLYSEYPEAKGKNLLVIHNKIDLTNSERMNKANADHVVVRISAANNVGIKELRLAIKEAVGQVTDTSNFIARRRHLIAIEYAIEHIARSIVGVTQKLGCEVLAEELRLAQQYLQEITGRFTADDLLGKIFSEFCIGK